MVDLKHIEALTIKMRELGVSAFTVKDDMVEVSFFPAQPALPEQPKNEQERQASIEQDLLWSGGEE